MRRQVAQLTRVVLAAFLLAATPVTSGASASEIAQGGTNRFVYDSPAASTTRPANARTSPFLSGDAAEHVSRVRTSTPGAVLATKGVPQKGEGLVYRRTDLNGGKPYVGQSKNEARFRARQQEHARGNPYSDFRYEVLGREAPGAQLERLEEYFIRRLGGPTNLRNPFGGLANRRHQMRDQRYFGAGGGY